jgi:23S rRNA (uracil1939-C5)-methyltransferase
MRQKPPVTINDQLRVEVIDLTHAGLGLAKIDGYPLFIEDALVNEIVLVCVTEVGKSYGRARVIQREKTSPKRVKLANSAHFETIRAGIAPLVHLNYSEQLKFKQGQIENALARIAKIPRIPVLDIVGMDKPYHYRNKAQVPVRMVKNQLEAGFFQKGSHQLIPLKDFYLNDPVIDETVHKLRNLLRELKMEPYNDKGHTGDLRHIIVRRGHYSHELMVVLVTRSKNFPREKQIVAEISKELPGIDALIQNSNPQKGSTILGAKNRVLYGKPFITDSLLGNNFQISPHSFYQVNTPMAELLYREAIDFAQLDKDDIAIDAYCGIGTLGQSFANNVCHVYGVDNVASAISDAKKNAQANGIKNASYVTATAEALMHNCLQEGIHPSVIFVDPPRKGLAKSFIEAAVASAPKRIVYISCNPATFARDIALFAEKSFNLQKVRPVDLFPQTPHVECVGLLAKD